MTTARCQAVGCAPACRLPRRLACWARQPWREGLRARAPHAGPRRLAVGWLQAWSCMHFIDDEWFLFRPERGTRHGSTFDIPAVARRVEYACATRARQRATGRNRSHQKEKLVVQARWLAAGLPLRSAQHRRMRGTACDAPAAALPHCAIHLQQASSRHVGCCLARVARARARPRWEECVCNQKAATVVSSLGSAAKRHRKASNW